MNKELSLLRAIHIGWVDLKNFDKTNKNAELGITIGNKDYWGKDLEWRSKQHVTNRILSVRIGENLVTCR